MFDLTTLITDRTQADVDRAKALAARGWENLSAAERAEWLAGLRAGGGAGYLNRLGGAINYVVEVYASQRQTMADYLAALGVATDARFSPPYDPAQLDFTQRADWERPETPTPDELEELLARVALLHGCFDFETDPLPESMLKLGFADANAIEKALKLAPAAGLRWLTATKADALATAQTWNYSGELYAGEIQEETA